MLVSVIIVHYRAPDLAIEAARTVLAECEAAGLRSELLVVDNGDDAGHRERLVRLPGQLVVPGENLGYAGGLNRGVAASRGDVLLLMNPDVMVRSGCVETLVGALDTGASAAGPRFFWDRAERLLLPPAEERSRRAELLGRLAVRSRTAASRLRRRWRRHARRHWEATEPLASTSLSGALLAVRRSAWDEVGPFDESYRLYFEETDWLRRLAHAGRTSLYVPDARAVHLYDRSASTEPRSRAWFRESRGLFERRWYGAPFTALLEGLDRLPAAGRADPPHGGEAGSPALLPPELDLECPPGLRSPLWVEISPTPLGVPAAAEIREPVAGRLTWCLPDEIRRRLEPGEYRLQLVDAAGREGPVRRLEKPAPPPEREGGAGLGG